MLKIVQMFSLLTILMSVKCSIVWLNQINVEKLDYNNFTLETSFVQAFCKIMYARNRNFNTLTQDNWFQIIFFPVAFRLCTDVCKDLLHFTLNVDLLNYITSTVVNGKLE